VSAAERDIASVARVRIDRERVPLDDRARQIKRRVLIPSAAREEVTAGDERQDAEPLGDALVALRNVEC
jgi:hypothetical protein